MSISRTNHVLERLFCHCMLRPADLAPVHDRMSVVGAFNPGAAMAGDEVVLLVRVVEEVKQRRAGWLAAPRVDADGLLVVDWLLADEYDLGDPRAYVRKSDGRLRLRFISHLQVIRSRDGKTPVRSTCSQVILPQGAYEEYGIEDPRITQIGETYYITYVAVSRHGVVTCLMSTTDFETFQRHGIIFCPDNKDVVLFPEQVSGSYVAMHRPMPSIKLSAPQIWLARSSDLFDWGNHEQLTGDVLADGGASSDRIGCGTPPVKTERGWLTIYHGADKSTDDPGAGIYTAGALLLELQNPKKIIGHVGPIMTPTEPFETRGYVNNVIFPTAVIERGDQYWVYYGAADENVGVVGFDKMALLGML